jgi:hypothetical protein
MSESEKAGVGALGRTGAVKDPYREQLRKHIAAIDGRRPHDGHSACGFSICPHPDCRTAQSLTRLPLAPTMADAAEMLWVVLANVSGGDWTKQSAEWREAAARWRDNYFAAVKAERAAAVDPPPRKLRWTHQMMDAFVIEAQHHLSAGRTAAAAQMFERRLAVDPPPDKEPKR